MNYMYLSDEKQAKKLARLLAQDADASDVKLYRDRNSYRCILVFNCRETRKQEQQFMRARRALEMFDGYQLVWAGDNGIVVGPKGQVYAGTLDQCACADMQKRMALLDEKSYRGACKHMLYRAADVLVRANRANLDQAEARKLAASAQPKQATARTRAVAHSA